MTIIRFIEVSMRAEKSVKCQCGKRLKRSKTFCQTINPFNKREDGAIKERDDIYRELVVEVKQWKTEPETCTQCEEKAL